MSEEDGEVVKEQEEREEQIVTLKSKVGHYLPPKESSLKTGGEIQLFGGAPIREAITPHQKEPAKVVWASD